MKYNSFRIQNFKGIKDTTVDLRNVAGANIFALVGLNESGKTTILEAIHSFSPDAATSELLGGASRTGVPFKDRVPRHLLSAFSDSVRVAARLSVSPSEKHEIATELLKKKGLVIDPGSIPDEVEIENAQRFEIGDFVEDEIFLKTTIKVKGPKQKKWRDPTDEEEGSIFDAFYNRAPDIAYFPTFVFNFPQSFFLTDRGTPTDKFYRSVFQDILDHDNRGYTIERDIVRRVRGEEMVVPWVNFLTLWSKDDARAKIQQVMDRASAAVTKLVFGRWNKIFGEQTGGKEIEISYDVAPGEIKDANGAVVKTDKHDIVAKFEIKDGSRRFNVNDRSLGFRWFFSFMLFTQFRVARSKEHFRPLLFLFDEPASNLHAAAQQKLIESFPEIAKDEHVLIYSTHSHYMIEPKWLEQTFIVTNRSAKPAESVLEEASLDDESLDVRASAYRSFVNAHPSQISYFQPILDRLEVVPSRFDAQRASIVVEGKSDYYILRYIVKLLKSEELPLLPGCGAGTFGALASLHAGWNLNFLFVLDGDRQGKAEKKRYAADYGISETRLVTTDELVEGISVVEDLLDKEALGIIQTHLGLDEPPNKGAIRRFFQERLAADKIIPLGNSFATLSSKIISELRERLLAA